MDEHKGFMERAKKSIIQAHSPDFIVTNLVNFIEELDKISNVVYERLRELYGLYNPELLEKEMSKEKFISEVKKMEKSEIGYNFNDEDKKFVMKLSKELESLVVLRNETLSYLDSLAKKEYSNLFDLLGGILTGRLINSAGSLKELARKSSSTIQIYGAEKALFRHKKTGARPPKHGYILQHSEVMSKPPKERGKAAKQLAAKICLVARKDYYGKND